MEKFNIDKTIENVDNKLEKYLDSPEKDSVENNKLEKYLDSPEKDSVENNKLEKYLDSPEKDTILFKCPEHLDLNEFKRQLEGQQKGINEMSLEQFSENRKNYLENGRIDTTKEQALAKDKLYWDSINEYIENGISYNEALEKANEKWSKSDALHNPDQIAGGDPYNITDWGDKEVNRSIGGQWRGKGDQLDQHVINRIKNENLNPEDLKNTKMSIKLEVA